MYWKENIQTASESDDESSQGHTPSGTDSFTMYFSFRRMRIVLARESSDLLLKQKNLLSQHSVDVFSKLGNYYWLFTTKEYIWWDI